MRYLSTTVTLLLLTCSYLSLEAQIPLHNIIYEQERYPGSVLGSGDFDGDGKPDYLLSSGCQLMNGLEAAELKRWDSSYFLEEAFVTDLDEDGDLDFITNSQSAVLLFRNDGQANFSIELIGSPPSLPHILGTEDVDGDGDLDVLLWRFVQSINDQAEIVLLKNMGAAESWQEENLYTLTELEEADQVLMEDIDGDDKADILQSSPDGLRLIRVHNSLLVQESSLLDEITAPQGTISTLDANGDGRTDLLIESFSSIRLLEQGANLQFTEGYVIEEFYTDVVASGDINADGYDDIVTNSISSGNGLLRLYLSVAPGSYDMPIEASLEFSEDDLASPPVIADLDQDGYPDLLVSLREKEDVLLLRYASESLESTLLFDQLLSSISKLAQHDVSGNGLADIILGSMEEGALAMIKNLGNDNFSDLHILREKASAYQTFLVNDLEGDGITDLFYLTDELVQLKISPEAEVLETITHEIQQGQTLLCEDLNEDGFLDIVLHDKNKFGFHYFLHDGSQGLMEMQTMALPDNQGNVDGYNFGPLFIDYDFDNDLDFLYYSVTNPVSQFMWARGQAPMVFASASSMGTCEESPNAFGSLQAMPGPNSQQWTLILSSGSALRLYTESGTEFDMEDYHHLFVPNTQGNTPIVDLNEDGQMDLMVVDGVLQYSSNLNSEELITFEPVFAFGSARLCGEFDGDGETDFILSTEDNRLLRYSTADPDPFPLPIPNPPEQSLSVKIYPNPSKEQLWLDISHQEHAQWTIYNAQGQHVQSGILKDQTGPSSIALGELPGGIYYCVVTIEDLRSSHKFLVLD